MTKARPIKALPGFLVEADENLTSFFCSFVCFVLECQLPVKPQVLRVISAALWEEPAQKGSQGLA